MRRILAAALVTLAACSDTTDIVDPVAANMVGMPPMTATTTINGVEYEYGCPDFPCPVDPIVTNQINQKLWFWMPSGTFNKPTIYLFVLRTPVQLRLKKETPNILPPVINTPPPPSLTGPTEWIGKPNGYNQLSCGKVPLVLDSPDGGPWAFANGQIEYEYGSVDPNTGVFTANGLKTVVGFNASMWDMILAGTYPFTAPYPTYEFVAHVSANLERSPHTAMVDHAFTCRLAPPPAPPAPSITGPTALAGQRSGGGTPLVCSGVHLALVSPDNGPWSFVSGIRRIEFLGWDGVKQIWVPNGTVTSGTLTLTAWNQLLAGTYSLSPGVTSGPYQATFTVTLARNQFQHTVSHTVVCGGPDYFGN